MEAKIKHVAIMSQNAPRLRSFYENLFGLQRPEAEVSRSQADKVAKAFGYPTLGSRPKRAAQAFSKTVWGIDGNIGVAFLRRRPGYPGGTDHFGIVVDDIERVCTRIKEQYPGVGVVKRPTARTFATYSTHDPEGNLIDLAQPGTDKRFENWAKGWEQERYITHLSIRAMNPEALASFYMDIYGFREEEKAPEDPNFYVTDGKVSLVLTPWKIEHYKETEHRGPGLDHVGFKVESVEDFKTDVETLRNLDTEWLSPQSPNIVSEYEVVLGLLAACRYGHHQLADPEGNFIDVSDS